MNRALLKSECAVLKERILDQEYEIEEMHSDLFRAEKALEELRAELADMLELLNA